MSRPPCNKRLRSQDPTAPCRTLESAARAALDSKVGRSLTDAEWNHTRTKLVEFVTILRRWDQVLPNASRLGRVD
jgi:hypothetical protein